MSKSRHNKNFNYFDEEDDFNGNKFRQEHRDRRKQKRMKRALKTKNIDELIRCDDDELEVY